MLMIPIFDKDRFDTNMKCPSFRSNFGLHLKSNDGGIAVDYSTAHILRRSNNTRENAHIAP